MDELLAAGQQFVGAAGAPLDYPPDISGMSSIDERKSYDLLDNSLSKFKKNMLKKKQDVYWRSRAFKKLKNS
jgi:hypothetical protein